MAGGAVRCFRIPAGGGKDVHEMSAHLTKGKFEQSLNTRFWLGDEGAEDEHLDLIEIENGGDAAGYEQFSLLFRGDQSKLYDQRMYRIKHNSLGTFDLFLTPVDRNDQGSFY